MLRVLLVSFLLLTSNAFAQNVNSLDPTQVYTTTNIVNNTTSPTSTTGTWQNLGLVNQGLPCWAPEDGYKGAYCGPLPYFNQGTFNFSYGVTDVYQIANIANALPNSGTGLRVNGYNFTFFAKNGNGWDGAGLDTLSAYVNFYGSDGKLLRNDYYDLNFKFDWSLFGYSKTFDSPYLTSDLSVARYGFVGGDTSNYWAGPYGPEVYNVGFSLKYSVDPCYINKLSSTSCPGYMEELNKLTAVSTPVQETTTAPTISEPVQVTTSTTQVATTVDLSLLSPKKEEKKENQSNDSSSLSFALSLIQSNRAKEQKIEQAAVAQANEVAQSAVAQAEKTAIETASNSLAQSLDVAKDSARNDNRENRTNTNSSFSLLPIIGSSNIQSNSSIVQQSQSLSNQLSLPVNTYNQQQVTISNNNISMGSGLYVRPEIAIPVPIAVQEIAQPVEIKPPANNSNINSQQVEQPNNSMSLFAKRGDPLTDYIEQNNILVAMAQPETKSTTVKTNVQDNELAGGIRIERMAVTPVGFNVYSLALRDVAFYEPKEIYKNVVIKDNVRTMYFIEKGNTDTYNKMIEEQYK
jgi:hypothetical protein